MLAPALLLLLAAEPEPALPLGVSLADCRKELRDADAEKRRVAAVKLGWLGPRAAPASAELARLLRDADAAVRLEACNALARIGAAAVPDLARALADPSPAVRWQALEVLRRLGPDASGAVPALAVCAEKDPRVKLRILAAQTLGRLGRDARAAVPALTRAAADRGHLHTTGIVGYADHPSAVAETAIAALRRIEPQALKTAAKAALPELRGMLTSKHFGDRRAAACALAEFRPHAGPAVGDVLAAIENDRANEDRLIAALAAAGDAGQKAALDLVEDGRRPPEFQQAVLAALADCPDLGGAAIRRLTALLGHRDGYFRALAAKALATQGPAAEPAIPALLQALADPAMIRRPAQGPDWGPPTNRAVVALACVGPRAVEPLRQALKDDQRRMGAIDALGRMGPAAKGARPALRELLGHTDTAVRVEAAAALLSIGEPPDARLQAAFAAGLRVGGPNRRCLEVLHHGGTPAGLFLWSVPRPLVVPVPREAAERLVDLLGDSQLGGQAAWALAGARPHAKAIVPRLAKMLRDAEGKQRRVVLTALEALGPAAAEAMPALVRQLQTPDGVRVLRAMGPRAREATPFLLDQLRRGDRDGRQAALYALAEVRPTSRAAGDALVAVLTARGTRNTRDDAGRCDAARALGMIGPAARAAVPALQQAATHPDSIVRLYATFALARVTGDPAYARLLALAGRDAYDVDDRYDVHEFAADALEALGPAAAPALPWLLTLLADTGEPRRDAERHAHAVRVLAAIGPPARAALPRLRELSRRGPGPLAARAAAAARCVEGK